MFYDNLKSVCEERNVKITPIVVECGGAKGSVSNWKNGALPNIEIVSKLAIRLGVSTDRLIFGSDIHKNSIKINDSNVGAIGNNSNGSTIINNDSCEELKEEITKILTKLPLKERTKLLSLIYDFEEKYDASLKSKYI